MLFENRSSIGRFKRTLKERKQFDNKKPEELKSEFDNSDVDNSYPTSTFKGRNIVDSGFVYRSKACKTTFSVTVSKIKIGRSCKHFIPQLPEL